MKTTISTPKTDILKSQPKPPAAQPTSLKTGLKVKTAVRAGECQIKPNGTIGDI